MFFLHTVDSSLCLGVVFSSTWQHDKMNWWMGRMNVFSNERWDESGKRNFRRKCENRDEISCDLWFISIRNARNSPYSSNRLISCWQVRQFIGKFMKSFAVEILSRYQIFTFSIRTTLREISSSTSGFEYTFTQRPRQRRLLRRSNYKLKLKQRTSTKLFSREMYRNTTKTPNFLS